MVAPLLQPCGQLNRHPASTQFRTRPVAQSLDRRTGARGQALPSSGIGISATSSAVPATAGTPIQDPESWMAPLKDVALARATSASPAS
jgi:hypothetical protein